MKKKKYILYCLIVSIISLLFTSKCSFFYAFNDWTDANAFFTVGKSIFNGVIPYKDLFEQKGLILFFIYGLGYLIFNKGFYGIFIFQIISLTIFLYYNHKIVKLFLEEKYSIIIIPILATITTTSASFAHGGSCEEFILPLMSISLYYYFKHFKEQKLNKKEIFLIGFLAGITSMMKYNVLGIWIGISLFIVIDYIKRKEIKQIINYCLIFLAGMIIPILLCIIYLLLNNALKDYIDCYLIFNIKYYGKKMTLIEGIKDLFNGVLTSFLFNKPIMFLFLYLPFSLRNLKENKYLKISILIITIIILIPVYIGHRYYIYYLLVVIPLLVIPMISLINTFKIYINKKILYVVPIICIPLCILGANYKEQLFQSKNNFPHFKYTKFINQYKNPTLLNMNTLDVGLYTTTNIIPNIKYFHVLNISHKIYPDNIDEMHKYVREKKVKFVVYTTDLDPKELKKYEEDLFKNYELVYKDKHMFEYEVEANMYLFKLKGLKK